MSRRTSEPEKERPLRVLVTGASGFIGMAIAERLINAGLWVQPTGQSDIDKSNKLPRYFKADVTAPRSLADALTGVEAVVHSAGLAHQFRTGKKRPPFVKVNVNGTENVARAAVRAGVKRFVLISSVSVYGSHGSDICDEESTCDPQEPYALSKREAEQRAIDVIHGSDMGLSILRLATVYGEGDPGNVARLMRTIDRGRFIWVGDGSNRKSLIHVKDVARACQTVLKHASKENSTYNVVGSVYTMREIVSELAASLGKNLPKWRMPPNIAKLMAISLDKIASRGKQHGHFERSVEKWLGDDIYDGSKFKNRFKFAESISLKEGLRQEVEWYRRNNVKNEKGERR